MAEEEKELKTEGIPDESLNVDPNRLFNWVMKETGNISYNNMPEEFEDDPNVTRLIDLDEEEREKWMSVLFGKPEDRISDFQRLKLCVAGLLKDSEGNLEHEEINDLLLNMHFLCEMPHIARNVFNIGAEQLVIKYCKHESEEIREHSAWIFHTCSGNNLKFKERFLEADGMKIIFDLIKNEESWIVKKKYIGTLCNLCRQFPPGIQSFIDHGGAELLQEWLPLQNKQTFGKTIRTLIELLHSNALTKEQINNLGMNTWVPDCLQSPKFELRSNTLEVLQLCSTSEFVDVIQRIPNLQFNLNISISTEHGDDPELVEQLTSMVEEIKNKLPSN